MKGGQVLKFKSLKALTMKLSGSIVRRPQNELMTSYDEGITSSVLSRGHIDCGNGKIFFKNTRNSKIREKCLL